MVLCYCSRCHPGGLVNESLCRDHLEDDIEYHSSLERADSPITANGAGLLKFFESCIDKTATSLFNHAEAEAKGSDDETKEALEDVSQLMERSSPMITDVQVDAAPVATSINHHGFMGLQEEYTMDFQDEHTKTNARTGFETDADELNLRSNEYGDDVTEISSSLPPPQPSSSQSTWTSSLGFSIPSSSPVLTSTPLERETFESGGDGPSQSSQNLSSSPILSKPAPTPVVDEAALSSTADSDKINHANAEFEEYGNTHKGPHKGLTIDPSAKNTTSSSAQVIDEIDARLPIPAETLNTPLGQAVAALRRNPNADLGALIAEDQAGPQEPRELSIGTSSESSEEAPFLPSSSLESLISFDSVNKVFPLGLSSSIASSSAQDAKLSSRNSGSPPFRRSMHPDLDGGWTRVPDQLQKRRRNDMHSDGDSPTKRSRMTRADGEEDVEAIEVVEHPAYTRRSSKRLAERIQVRVSAQQTNHSVPSLTGHIAKQNNAPTGKITDPRPIEISDDYEDDEGNLMALKRQSRNLFCQKARKQLHKINTENKGEPCAQDVLFRIPYLVHTDDHDVEESELKWSMKRQPKLTLVMPPSKHETIDLRDVPEDSAELKAHELGKMLLYERSLYEVHCRAMEKETLRLVRCNQALEQKLRALR